MAKRKLGASVIILCIAAITLISGTYAWFLSGGAANLFDIGFDVIESDGSLLLQGDAGTYGGGKTDNGGWGTELDRPDFTAMSFIVEGGKYRPISGSNFSQTAARFVVVNLENDVFTSSGMAPSKADASDASNICYNDFTFRIKSGGDEIVGSSNAGAWMTVDLTGEKKNADTGELDNTDSGDISAANAARVAVTIDGTTTVYSIDGESYQAVTTAFGNEITDAGDKNRIIDSSEDTSGSASLAAPGSYAALKSGDTLQKIYLGNIPNNASSGKTVTVRIWLEGNDKDCVDFADRTIAGKSLMSKLHFGIDA